MVDQNLPKRVPCGELSRYDVVVTSREASRGWSPFVTLGGESVMPSGLPVSARPLAPVVALVDLGLRPEFAAYAEDRQPYPLDRR